MRRPTAPVPLLAALLAAAVLLTGCSSSGEDAAMSGGDASAAAGEAANGTSGGGGGSAADGALRGGGVEGAAGGSGAAGGGSAAAAPDGKAAAPDGQTAVSSRALPAQTLILTGELTVRVEDVSAAADEAARTATAAGGSVQAEERSRGTDDGSAVVVLRVPPRAFDATLAELAELGEELGRRRGTQDVTEEVVDLDTRIASQRASVARVRALLDRANTIGEIVQVEAELTRRTADLESLEARLAVLAEQAEQATITLRLEGEDAAGALAGGPLGFGDGLQAGWDALVAFGRAVGVTAGALLPFTPLLIAAALLWRVRTRRAGRPASPGPASA